MDTKTLLKLTAAWRKEAEYLAAKSDAIWSSLTPESDDETIYSVYANQARAMTLLKCVNDVLDAVENSK